MLLVTQWGFDNLSGSHPQSQVNSVCQSMKKPTNDCTDDKIYPRVFQPIPSWLNWPITFNGPDLQHRRLINTTHLTLKMTSAQVVETSVTNNISFPNYLTRKITTNYFQRKTRKNFMRFQSVFMHMNISRLATRSITNTYAGLFRTKVSIFEEKGKSDF